MKKISAFLITFLVMSSIMGQEMTKPVKISAKNLKQDSLKVYEVSSENITAGNLLYTTTEYLIENKTNKLVEGEFEFPLEENESITGFALDIDGKFREAVSVEKEKGREVFESVVRRGIDPALAEKTAGNNYKIRVYPINANGVRHVKVHYIKMLNSQDNVSDKTCMFTEGKNTYFFFNQPVKKSDKSILKPAKINLYFDTSNSISSRNLQKEMDFLAEYFNQLLKDGLKPEIAVHTFNINCKKEKKFSLDQSTISELQKLTAKFNYDGATNLSCVLNLKSDADEDIIFSDGIDNWNQEEIKSTAKRIVTVNSSNSADFGRLKKLAMECNGVFINLASLNVSEAVNLVRKNPLRVISVEYDSNSISDVYPLAGEIINGDFSVAGNLKKKSGTLKISIGQNGKVTSVIEKEISIGDKDIVESELAAKIWAQKKIDSLMIDSDKNRSQIIDTAKQYTIVTDFTSLIVLDSVYDYVRYGITPPDELKNEYNKIAAANNLTKGEEYKISRKVYDCFDSFKKWWNKTPEDFKKEANKKPPKEPGLFMRTTRNFAIESVAESDFVYEDMAPVAERSVASAPIAKAMVGNGLEFDDYKNSTVSGSSSNSTVILQSWSSNSDYISTLKKTPADKMYSKYLELKKEYGFSPAFFMEVSDYFASEDDSNWLLILSNLAEFNLENSDILRALGNKLVEQKEYNLASFVFRKLTVIRGEIPQFYRDLGLALHNAGRDQEAVDSLWTLVSKKWDSRFDEIQQTALNDMNSIIANSKSKLDLSAIDKKLQQNFDVDLRVVLTWNTDDCDVDLWVTDPSKEKCYYGHKLTANGGRMSRDFTMGYGPEEFCIKKAPKGEYLIEANYFGSHQQKVLQPVIVQAEVYTNFGRPDQKCQILTLQLDDVKQTFKIGTVNLE